MPGKKRSIAERLHRAQVAIDNSLANEEIQSHVGAFGYTLDRLNEGKALYDTAVQQQQTLEQEYGDQYEATDTLTEVWEQADDVYIQNVKVSRVAFRDDPGAFRKLALNGRRKESLAGWLAQARQFYTNALADADIMAGLGTFGRTAETLQAGLQLVDDTEAANAAQEKERGEAQQQRVERDVALDKMDDWVSDYIEIARVALADKPQLLEILGILERSD